MASCVKGTLTRPLTDLARLSEHPLIQNQMSAFLSSGDALNALATYWTMSSSRGYSSAIGELKRAFYCHQRDCQLTGADQ